MSGFSLAGAAASFSRSSRFDFIERGGGVGMDGDGSVAEHRFGARGGDGDEFVGSPWICRIDHWVADVPEVALHRFVIDFVVGDGGLQVGVPIHEPLAAEDQAVFEHFEERVADGAAHISSSVNRVRRQSQLKPIWRNCSRMRVSYLSFHCQMRLTNSSRPSLWRSRFSSSLQAAFDDGLRGDAGVVGAGHPEGVVTLHPFEADDDVLQRVVEGVAEMQGAGDVRGRDDDGEGCFISRMPSRAVGMAPGRNTAGRASSGTRCCAGGSLLK